MRRIGVLGGGQLGTMLAGAIHDLGAEACIYEPDAAAPACARFREVVNAPWTDGEALERFFSSCDAVTYEMEHIDTRALKVLRTTTALLPKLSVLDYRQGTCWSSKEQAILTMPFRTSTSLRIIRMLTSLSSRCDPSATATTHS